MSAAHGGFGSEIMPLGGGAAIFERLAASRALRRHDLCLLGAGPNPCQSEGIEYRRVLRQDAAPSSLSMLDYARFSQDFGEATTNEVLKLRPDVLLCHDISEGPDVEIIAKAGIPVVTIFHVDVVDIFSRLYMHNFIDPVVLTNGYRRTRHLPWPSLLRLVFEKQQKVADFGALSITPSRGAQRLLEACYPESPAPVVTLGWGAPNPRFQETDILQRASELRAQYRIPSHHRIVLTLSRLSPEKAQHRLLEAVKLSESDGSFPDDVTVVIAGAPAFMEGKKHARRLKALAKKLQTRVLFPGHVGGLEKTAWYEMASLFVVNSLHESYGLTTLEAMQRGCPVVAVQSFGTSDTVSDEVGILVPKGPDLIPRLLGTILLLLSDKSSLLVQDMAHKARLKATKETFDKAASALTRELEKFENRSQ